MNTHIRLATPEDNAGLLALARAVPIEGKSLSYYLERGPEYAQLSRIQGSEHRTLVAEQAGEIVGTISVIVDEVYLAKTPSKVAYTTELKLLPKARGQGLGDRLMQAAVKLTQETFESPLPIYTCVMTDNPRGLKKNQNLGSAGVTQMNEVGRITGHFLLPVDTRWRKTHRYHITPLKPTCPELHDFWQQYAPHKHLSRHYQDRAWPDAPNLRFWVARDTKGDMQACVGVWDQRAFRKVILTADKVMFKLMRSSLQRLPLANFPTPGEALPLFHALHPCCAPGAENALPELLAAAFVEIRKKQGLLLGLALDAQDPLNLQLKPFLSSSSHFYLLSNRPHHQRGLFQVEMSLG